MWKGSETGAALAFFTNEEGASFQPDMRRSLVMVGGCRWMPLWPGKPWTTVLQGATVLLQVLLQQAQR